MLGRYDCNIRIISSYHPCKTNITPDVITSNDIDEITMFDVGFSLLITFLKAFTNE